MMRVKGRYIFGHTRRFTAVGNAERLEFFMKNVCFSLGGCKIGKVQLFGDYGY